MLLRNLLFLICLLSSAFVNAIEYKFDAYIRQSLSKNQSDDNSSAFTQTGAVPKLNQYNTFVFKTDTLFLNATAKLSEELSFYFRYAILDNISAPSGNLLEMANLSYRASDKLKVTAGRQYNKAGGIEVNYFPIGSWYMYSLANLNLLNGNNTVSTSTALVLSVYTDGLSMEYKPFENHTFNVLVGNINLANSTSSAFLNYQTVPSYTLTWEGKYLEGQIIPFVSYVSIPIPPNMPVTGGTAPTWIQTDITLSTAGARYISGPWTSHLDFQYYDLGNAKTAVTPLNRNIESAEVFYLAYKTESQTAHKLTLSRTEIAALQQYYTQIRNGIAYAYEYKPYPIATLYGLVSYTQDAFNATSSGALITLNGTTIVNPQPLINNYNLTVGYRLSLQ